MGDVLAHMYICPEEVPMKRRDQIGSCARQVGLGGKP